MGESVSLGLSGFRGLGGFGGFVALRRARLIRDRLLC